LTASIPNIRKGVQTSSSHNKGPFFLSTPPINSIRPPRHQHGHPLERTNRITSNPSYLYEVTITSKRPTTITIVPSSLYDLMI
jgi:hypothetical protein